MLPICIKVAVRSDVQDPYFSRLIGAELLFIGMIEGAENAVVFNMDRQLTESGIPLAMLEAV